MFGSIQGEQKSTLQPVLEQKGFDLNRKIF